MRALCESKELDHVPWEGWVDTLNEKFVPSHVRSQLMSKFDTFWMTGSMTVDEYFARFNELASHVTDRNLLGKHLAYKFERRRSYAILFKLPPGDAGDLDDVYTRVGQAERILNLAH